MNPFGMWYVSPGDLPVVWFPPFANEPMHPQMYTAPPSFLPHRSTGEYDHGITPSPRQVQAASLETSPPSQSTLVPSFKKVSAPLQPKATQRKPIRRDSEYRVKGQNSKRNVFSNIIRHMMSFLRRPRASLELINKILKRHNLSVTSDDFYKYVGEIYLPNYINMSIINGIWFGKEKEGPHLVEDLELRKVMRIASYNFLAQSAHRCILLAKKIREEIKTDHYARIRYAMALLRQEHPRTWYCSSYKFK